MKSKKKILIVDSHPLVREKLSKLINLEEDVHVCGGTEDVQDALERIEEHKPDLAIVDIKQRTHQGLDSIRAIRTRFPGVSVLVVSLHDGARFVEMAIQAGANGYLDKQMAATRIMTAIRTVLRGDVYRDRQDSD